MFRNRYSNNASNRKLVCIYRYIYIYKYVYTDATLVYQEVQIFAFLRQEIFALFSRAIPGKRARFYCRSVFSRLFMVLAIPCSESLLYQEATCERFHASVAGAVFLCVCLSLLFLPFSSLLPLFALCNRPIPRHVSNYRGYVLYDAFLVIFSL